MRISVRHNLPLRYYYYLPLLIMALKAVNVPVAHKYGIAAIQLVKPIKLLYTYTLIKSYTANSFRFTSHIMT